MEVYLAPLILTIIIELAVVYLLGFREKPILLAVVLVNIVTNPTLNYIISNTINLYMDFGISYILFLEVIVVLAEYLMLKLALKNIKIDYFKLSLVINGCSFLIGLILFW